MSEPNRVETIVTRIVSGTTAAMILCTWPLWCAQTSFPQIPITRLLCNAPAAFDVIGLVSTLLGLVFAFCFAANDRTRRWGLSLAMGGMVLLIALDQHRLQPWAYYFVLVAWMLAFCETTAIVWLRWLVISLYAYSAVGKFDFTFSHTMGVRFVETTGQLFGFPLVEQNFETASRLAFILPLVELVVACLLAVPRIRRFGVVAAVAMHLSLLILLGPLGMNHRWAVLVWNLSCILQVFVLFGVSLSPRPDLDKRRPRWFIVTNLPVFIALVMPLTCSWEWWDAWPSWGLYSSRVGKAEIFFAADSVADLPEAVRPYCEPNGPAGIWVRCAIDRWSLDELQAPLYPHPRFNIGVGLAIANAMSPKKRWLTVVTQSIPNRFTGAVAEFRYVGYEEVLKAADRYWINAMPRTRSAGQLDFAIDVE